MPQSRSRRGSNAGSETGTTPSGTPLGGPKEPPPLTSTGSDFLKSKMELIAVSTASGEGKKDLPAPKKRGPRVRRVGSLSIQSSSPGSGPAGGLLAMAKATSPGSTTTTPPAQVNSDASAAGRMPGMALPHDAWDDQSLSSLREVPIVPSSALPPVSPMTLTTTAGSDPLPDQQQVLNSGPSSKSGTNSNPKTPERPRSRGSNEFDSHFDDHDMLADPWYRGDKTQEDIDAGLLSPHHASQVHDHSLCEGVTHDGAAVITQQKMRNRQSKTPNLRGTTPLTPDGTRVLGGKGNNRRGSGGSGGKGGGGPRPATALGLTTSVFDLTGVLKEAGIKTFRNTMKGRDLLPEIDSPMPTAFRERTSRTRAKLVIPTSSQKGISAWTAYENDRVTRCLGALTAFDTTKSVLHNTIEYRNRLMSDGEFLRECEVLVQLVKESDPDFVQVDKAAITAQDYDQYEPTAAELKGVIAKVAAEEALARKVERSEVSASRSAGARIKGKLALYRENRYELKNLQSRCAARMTELRSEAQRHIHTNMRHAWDSKEQVLSYRSEKLQKHWRRVETVHANRAIIVEEEKMAAVNLIQAKQSRLDKVRREKQEADERVRLMGLTRGLAIAVTLAARAQGMKVVFMKRRSLEVLKRNLEWAHVRIWKLFRWKLFINKTNRLISARRVLKGIAPAMFYNWRLKRKRRATVILRVFLAEHTQIKLAPFMHAFRSKCLRLQRTWRTFKLRLEAQRAMLLAYAMEETNVKRRKEIQAEKSNAAAMAAGDRPPGALQRGSTFSQRGAKLAKGGNGKGMGKSNRGAAKGGDTPDAAKMADFNEDDQLLVAMQEVKRRRAEHNLEMFRWRRRAIADLNINIAQGAGIDSIPDNRLFGHRIESTGRLVVKPPKIDLKINAAELARLCTALVLARARFDAD